MDRVWNIRNEFASILSEYFKLSTTLEMISTLIISAERYTESDASSEVFDEWIEQTYKKIYTQLTSIKMNDAFMTKHIFPPCSASLAVFSTMKHMYNAKYLALLQPLMEIDHLTASWRVGRDPYAYGRLAPILLASILPPSSEFKAYCCNFGDNIESNLFSPERDDHFPGSMQKTICKWVAQLYSTPYLRRSCVIVKYTSEFRQTTTPQIVSAGHSIAIGFDAAEKSCSRDTFRIYDYRVEEYVYDVHEQLLNMVRNAVLQQRGGGHAQHRIITEVVSLKGKLMVDNGFMTCMALAFRVCVCLAKRLPLHEDANDFTANSANLQHHIFAMLRWTQTEPKLQGNQYTVLVSQEMAEPLFEVSLQNCYLLLAPYNPSSPASGDVQPGVVMQNALLEPSTLRARYSLQTGFAVGSNADAQ